MAYLREGLAAYAKEYFDSQFLSPFAVFHPLPYVLSLYSGNEAKNIGRPGFGAVLSTLPMGEGERAMLAHSHERYFSFAKRDPNDGAFVGAGEETPVASSSAHENAGQYATRWSEVMEPIKIERHALRMARSRSEVMSIVETQVALLKDRLYRRLNTAMWSGTLTQAQQDDPVWKNLLGLTHVMGTSNNYYGRVDRSVETNLNPKALVAGTDTSSTKISLELIDIVNVGNATFTTGLAARSSNGRGATLHITTPSLWQTLRKEAHGLGSIRYDGIPNHPFGGFKYPFIEYNGHYIFPDESCPSGTCYHVNPDTWLMEVHPMDNFRFQEFVAQDETEMGGAWVEWSKINLMLRFSCRAPYLNAVTTALTAS